MLRNFEGPQLTDANANACRVPNIPLSLTGDIALNLFEALRYHLNVLEIHDIACHSLNGSVELKQVEALGYDHVEFPIYQRQGILQTSLSAALLQEIGSKP